MRTTVTLDPDLLAAVRDLAHRAGKPFKTALNDTLRAGLSSARAAGTVEPPEWPVFDMGLPLVDLTKALALADELDDQALSARTSAPPP